MDEIEYESIIKYNDVIDVEETPIVTPTPKLKRSKKVK